MTTIHSGSREHKSTYNTFDASHASTLPGKPFYSFRFCPIIIDGSKCHLLHIWLPALLIHSRQNLIPSAIYNLYLRPLSRFPGPKTCVVSPIPYLQEMQNGDLVHRIKELHEKDGEIVRTAPDELSLINASALHDLYGHHPGRGTRPRWGYGAVPTGVQNIFNADDSEHPRYRRLMARGFLEKALRDMEPILQNTPTN